ncbi:Lrp/AsnC ligand binding domain-containing protein [Haloglomus litoreum]|uniref:Lrp/AsnC ligand binding domain-containing protein n=1 Tax=Haloglomus litoreum TaxID=3034026 RepID=UPI0023E8A526|nr:Lrp/AsnC ligand binding domain-containing protein [Haloglomus sp. DT116]
MVRAFIMVKAEAGYAESTLEAVLELERVTEANVVAGDFDLVVEAEGEEVYDVLHSASNAIRAIEGVTDTKTYVCLE